MIIKLPNSIATGSLGFSASSLYRNISGTFVFIHEDWLINKALLTDCSNQSKNDLPGSMEYAPRTPVAQPVYLLFRNPNVDDDQTIYPFRTLCTPIN